MIYTLTMNPAIDMNISSEGIEAKKVNRTFDTVYSPNGKGLNVSFVLNHFGVNSTVLGFFGDFSGKYIVDKTKERQLMVLPVWVEEATRINIFLNDGKEEYKFVNSGSYISEQKQLEMLNLIASLKDMEYLSISGSLPKGINPNYYDSIMEICKNKKTKVILDISSSKLKELLQYNPFLIKPNDEEITEIFGIIMRDEDDIKDVLKYLGEKGAQNVLLTMGEKGAYFYNKKNIYYVNTTKIELLSSACAGDSALAGFLSLWLENPKNIEEALKRSSATGANVAESNALGNLAKVKEYIKKLNVRKIE